MSNYQHTVEAILFIYNKEGLLGVKKYLYLNKENLQEKTWSYKLYTMFEDGESTTSIIYEIERTLFNLNILY